MAWNCVHPWAERYQFRNNTFVFPVIFLNKDDDDDDDNDDDDVPVLKQHICVSRHILNKGDDDDDDDDDYDDAADDEQPRHFYMGVPQTNPPLPSHGRSCENTSTYCKYKKRVKDQASL